MDSKKGKGINNNIKLLQNSCIEVTMKGYIGKILKINLSAKTFESINIEDEIYEKYLSGAGLGAWYIYKNIPAGCDPLGEENVLGFTSGLLTGTGSVLTGRFMVVTKSPLIG